MSPPASAGNDGARACPSVASGNGRVLAATGEELARAVVQEINVFRRDPQKYAEEMTRLQECYQNNALTYPESGLVLQTSEGVTALQDCLQDLFATPPLPTMMISPAICRSCQHHLADLQTKNFCSHIGSDGSTPEARLSRVGEHREQCGENAVFGMQSAKETVYHMLIDDGSPERGHRANLLNPDFRFVGVASGRHPSADTATIVLLTDSFRAREASHSEQKQNIQRTIRGATNVPDDEDPDKAWDGLMNHVKPAHLRVPAHIHDIVHGMDKPKLYLRTISAVPQFSTGALKPSPGVDPAIVRAFVHRVDSNHDDQIEEHELTGICHHHQLNVSPEAIAHMFDEITEQRQRNEQCRRAVNWAELFAAIRPQRRWVPAIDVHVERDSDTYQLIVEVEALTQWCEEVFAEFGPLCAETLETPPRMATGAPRSVAATSSDAEGGAGGRGGAGAGDDATKPLPRNSQGAANVRGLNAFLASVLSATIAETEEPLQKEPKVSTFLGLPASGGAHKASSIAHPPIPIQSVKCMGHRRLWAYHTRPYREAWLRLFHAVGLDPLLQPHAKDARQPRAKGLAPGAGKMQIRDVPEGVRLGLAPEQQQLDPTASSPAEQLAAGQATPSAAERGEQAITTGGSSASGAGPTNTGKPKAAAQPLRPWDEKRQQAENLVNQYIHTEDPNTTAKPGAAAESGAPQMAYTFQSQRKFLQVLAGQQRASDEQRFLAAVRSLGPSVTMGSTTKIGMNGTGARTFSATSAPPGSRSRGAGASSLSAPGGVGGHFHNTSALHSAADSSHSWPRSLEVKWDGVHIDHTQMEPLRTDAKLSTMTHEERARQFSCLGAPPAGDCFAAKTRAAAEQYVDTGRFRDFRNCDFRPDRPQRHGKFGRRAFDPQVQEKPLGNPHRVSEVESKPQEEFRRQNELVEEFLDRSLPPKQRRHFQTCLPQSQMPGKRSELADHKDMPYVMDGDQQKVMNFFGQPRNRDVPEMKLHTRPLGASYMDRRIPLA